MQHDKSNILGVFRVRKFSYLQVSKLIPEAPIFLLSTSVSNFRRLFLAMPKVARGSKERDDRSVRVGDRCVKASQQPPRT